MTSRRTNHLPVLLKRIVLLVALVAPACSLAAQNLTFGSREAKSVPEWLYRATIYELWLNAFTPEGNLKAATPRLKEIADLGATIVYLGPIAKRAASPNASPYSIADYNEVDPECGTAQDLREFVAAAHKLHLKVMLDIVYYHTAPDNTMLQQDPSFFVKTADGKIARGFWPQPLPDFKNPAARKYLIDSLVHWARDFDVDGFRCDVGAGVPVSFWEDARKALDQVKPEVVMLSESDRPDDQLNAFDINYNFQYYLTLRSVLRDGAPAIRLRENWNEMHATLPMGARVLHYTDNHDWPRSVLQFGRKAAMAANVLDFTLDGIPFVYNGQEVDDASATPWRKLVPIRWSGTGNGDEDESMKETRAQYKKLFALRANEQALSKGSVIWIDNTEPNSVLSFLRKSGDSEVLVILNLSNRATHVTIDMPVMDAFAVENLLSPGKTWFQLYSGRVSAELGAFEYVLGKKIPLAPLQKQ